MNHNHIHLHTVYHLSTSDMLWWCWCRVARYISQTPMPQGFQQVPQGQRHVMRMDVAPDVHCVFLVVKCNFWLVTGDAAVSLMIAISRDIFTSFYVFVAWQSINWHEHWVEKWGVGHRPSKKWLGEHRRGQKSMILICGVIVNKLTLMYL